MALPSSLKNFIQKDHLPINRFTLEPVGLGLITGGVSALTFLKVSSIERKIETWELPNRTFASRGISEPFEFTAVQPLHHQIEYYAMELWQKMSIDPVVPGYALPCLLRIQSVNGLRSMSYVIEGAFPFGKKLPELDVEDEGTIATVEWMFKADEIFPLPPESYNIYI